MTALIIAATVGVTYLTVTAVANVCCNQVEQAAIETKFAPVLVATRTWQHQDRQSRRNDAHQPRHLHREAVRAVAPAGTAYMRPPLALPAASMFPELDAPPVYATVEEELAAITQANEAWLADPDRTCVIPVIRAVPNGGRQ